ncbi:MAG: family 78 glycoside hydrolase catalytic domain [Blautia sp.]|nr:family 78 glycoside hydrolase catalytic domain [Blautia sp.]
MRAVRLRCDYLETPLGLGNVKPRFYWNVSEGMTQTAYRIQAFRGGEQVWDSGKVRSSSMTHIPYEGTELHSRHRVIWKVTLWDEEDRPGETTESWFELGLLKPEDWVGKWISGNYSPKKKKRYPVDCFRKIIQTGKTVKKARLYATARGIYDVSVNGNRIKDFVFAPGMTDYRKRIQYQTYDLTKYFSGPIQKTEDPADKLSHHTLEFRLADGWYRGSSAAYGVTNVYGTRTSLLAQLELEYTDGTREVIGTDDSFDWSNNGPLRFADLKDGEKYDARRTVTYEKKAITVNAPKGVRIVASDNVPVKEQEHFKPTVIAHTENHIVLDFGQNIAGYLSFTVSGELGQRLRFLCGEVLDDKKNVDLSGIQETRPAKGWNQMQMVTKLLGKELKGDVDVTPHQEIRFICSGQEDHYQTSFAIFGFRYVQIDAENYGEKTIDQILKLDRVGDAFDGETLNSAKTGAGAHDHRPDSEPGIEAIAVYSDLEDTGSFRCSNEKVNRLLENTRWSMKGNFLDIPTDCPTRERLGWTGDAQIFFDTGAYLSDTASFFRKWLRDMEDAQYKNGVLPAVFPYQGVEMMYKATGTSVGWADAVYLIPWKYYLRYGDRRILEASWPMMKRYADYLLGHLGMKDKKEAKANPFDAYTYEKGVHLGEWLEPEEFRDKIYGTGARHPEECTAYLHLTMEIMARIAALLGRQEEKETWQKYAKGARQAYDHLFVKTGTLDTDRQAKLVRPLALGLLDGEEKRKAQNRLKQAVENYDYCVGTGFLSTPFLLSVLTEAGELDTAYRMLENEKAPGWLAEINAGATTVWENWEGDLSQNHYSPGTVCGWLFDTVCGIRPAGENRFIIEPQPGGTLTFAKSSYQSIYGRIESGWKKTEDGYVFSVTVPGNVIAEVILPDGVIQECTAGSYQFIVA